MDAAQIRFSARFNPLDAINAHPSASVVRVRDVLICAGGGTDVSPEEFRAHLPVASPTIAHSYGRDGQAVELGRKLSIDRLSDDDARLVVNACLPRGHLCAPLPQPVQRYAYIRDIDPDEWPENQFRWDSDDVIYDALSLSRLVRDNADSMQFAARIADFEGGEQSVAYALSRESKYAYRLRRERDWLDENEAGELRALLGAYWACRDDLPERVRNAMWRTEYASWLAWADLALPILVSGLESLLKTERFHATRQFTTRVPALAAELGFDAIDADYCACMYRARSEWVHGMHVRLFATGIEAVQAPEQGSQQGPATDSQRKAFADIARLQDVLRRAVRRCIEDDELRGTFADDDLIRARWPFKP